MWEPEAARRGPGGHHRCSPDLRQFPWTHLPWPLLSLLTERIPDFSSSQEPSQVCLLCWSSANILVNTDVNLRVTFLLAHCRTLNVSGAYPLWHCLVYIYHHYHGNAIVSIAILFCFVCIQKYEVSWHALGTVYVNMNISHVPVMCRVKHITCACYMEGKAHHSRRLAL